MTVECDLHGPRGETLRVEIRLSSFLMNPEWKKDPKIAYVEQWLPTHLDYKGPVFVTSQPPLPTVAVRLDVTSNPSRIRCKDPDQTTFKPPRSESKSWWRNA